jgi:hypothetical protein
MTDARATRYELGWLVANEEIEAVHLAEMLDLRRQWPVLYQNATTSREQTIVNTLDAGIKLALLAIGVTPVPTPGHDGDISIFVDRAKNPSEEARQADWGETAMWLYEAVKEVIANENFDERDRQDVVLAEALSGASAHLYGGTFAPPPIDEDALGWWQVLGYDSFEEWLAAPPWWQREGYSSLAEADAARADEEADE